MTWYWGKWSKYLQEKVAVEEARDPSSVTVTNKFYCTTTTTTREYWGEDQLIKSVIGFLGLGCSIRTGNLLDVMVCQRMAYGPTELKAFIQKLRQEVNKAYPECRWDTSPISLYLWK